MLGRGRVLIAEIGNNLRILRRPMCADCILLRLIWVRLLDRIRLSGNLTRNAFVLHWVLFCTLYRPRFTTTLISSVGVFLLKNTRYMTLVFPLILEFIRRHSLLASLSPLNRLVPGREVLVIRLIVLIIPFDSLYII